METLLHAATLLEHPPRSFVTFVAPLGYKMGDIFNIVTCHGDQVSFMAKGNGRVMHLPVTQPIKKITHTPALSQHHRVAQYVKKRNLAETRRKAILKRQETTRKAIEKEFEARHLRAKLESKTVNGDLLKSLPSVAPSSIHNSFSSLELCDVDPPSGVSLLTTTREKLATYEEAMNRCALHTKRVVLATRVHSVQQ